MQLIFRKDFYAIEYSEIYAGKKVEEFAGFPIDKRTKGYELSNRQ